MNKTKHGGNTSEKSEIIKNKAGCPCRMNGDCCNNPDVTGVEHDCPDNDEGELCEGCYGLECQNCGDVCYHEL